MSEKWSFYAPQAFPLHTKEWPMTNHSPSDASVLPFNDQAKTITPTLNIKPALMAGLNRSKRVLGTLHLPAIVWPR